MSFNLRNIREISNDPLSKFANEIGKKLSAFITKDQIDQLDDVEDIYTDGQDIDTIIKFHDELEATNKFNLTTLYYPPFEPDGDKLQLWIRGVSQGNSLRDYSLTDKAVTLFGDPLLMDGTPFDDGTKWGGTKSTCIRLNRPTSNFVNEEYISVASDTSLQVSGIATGISYFIRFRMLDIAQQGGISRTLFEKIDDTTPNNGVLVKVSSSGRLLIFIKRGGTEYNWESNSGVISANAVYDLWITYNVSGNVVHAYLNNVDLTLSTGSSPSWHSTLTNLNLAIFYRGGTSTNGFVYGDLYDFRVYREKVVTSNSIGNSVLFDGSNDYIDCGNQASVWSKSLDKFSFSFWMYPTVLDATSRVMVEHGGGTAQGFRCSHSNNDLVFNCYDSGAVLKQATSTGDALFLNNWNHITCTYDKTLGSANVKCYVNAIVGGVTANLTESLNKSATLRISESTTDFGGYIRDFRFWDSKALTQAEIIDIINDLSSAPIPTYQLALTEGSGTPTDLIGGLTATLTNGASWVSDEVGNHYFNGWTIADIPFEQVMISNYFSAN